MEAEDVDDFNKDESASKGREPDKGRLDTGEATQAKKSPIARQSDGNARRPRPRRQTASRFQ